MNKILSITLLGVSLAVITFPLAVSADVIYQPVTYSPGAVAGWQGIDFDGDGAAELSFEIYAIGHEMGGVIFLAVHGSQNAEVLLENGRAVPLQAGDTVLPTPVSGAWRATGYQSLIWTWNYSFPGRDTNIIVFIGDPPQGDPPPQPPPGQGVGMPGFGNFIGVRFFSGGGWHYAWVRFGIPDSSSALGLPGILGYAYETNPNTPILAGAGIDSDQDGVWDLLDRCPDTPSGTVVNADGCSITQLCPCNGLWRNHGDYVNSVQNVASSFLRAGVITSPERRAIVSRAAASNCGSRR